MGVSEFTIAKAALEKGASLTNNSSRFKNEIAKCDEKIAGNAYVIMYFLVLLMSMLIDFCCL